MASLNCGVRIPSVHPTDTAKLREFVLAVERLGLHSVWAGDHVFYRVDVLQPLHLLTWVSALTSRVKLGTAIMLSAYLNPVLLAKAAATIDVLSEGRLSLGMSIGGTEAEYQSIGVPMNQRVGRLVESVAIMRKLWSEDDVTFDGRYHQVEHGTINPKPAQAGGIPIYFGAGQEVSMKRMARLADGWVGSGGTTPESYVDGVGQVLSYLKDLGRDPAGFEFAKLHQVSLDRDPAAARANAERHWHAYYGPRFDIDKQVIHGTPAMVGERLKSFMAADSSEVTLALEPSTLEPSQLELLVEAVEHSRR